MPPEPLPWDRRGSFFKERRHERGPSFDGLEAPGGGGGSSTPGGGTPTIPSAVPRQVISCTKNRQLGPASARGSGWKTRGGTAVEGAVEGLSGPLTMKRCHYTRLGTGRERSDQSDGSLRSGAARTRLIRRGRAYQRRRRSG